MQCGFEAVDLMFCMMTTMTIVMMMMMEVYLITTKILQVLKTKDTGKVKEQFLRMVHSLFLQVFTTS